MFKKIFFLSFLCLALYSCSTYYKVNQDFNHNFEQGNLESAQKVLAEAKKLKKSKATSLHYMNQGVVASMLGQYEESNQFFEKAYLFIEDYQKNYLNEAVALVSNPMMAEYKPENHEELFIHYYKALNFIKMGQKEEALVECKRMDLKLQAFAEKYKSDKKYKRDAIIHTLMGLVYDANGEYNDAFIAYRNALTIYKEDYEKIFGISAPLQLKKDILRTAYLMNFDEELRQYEEEFGIKHKPTPKGSGDVVYFWNNGLGPIKAEWSINFVIQRGHGGAVVFANEDLGLNFAFQMSDDDYNSSGLGSLGILRVAFPKYEERIPINKTATVRVNGMQYPLELMEDVNAIAFKSLQQRMLKELGTSLLRLGLKKAAEYSVRKENEGLGAVVGIFNAITEKADTRNWQTLPHSIYYTRINLPEGEHSLQLLPERSGNASGLKPVENKFDLKVSSGRTYFYSHYSLATYYGY